MGREIPLTMDEGYEALLSVRVFCEPQTNWQETAFKAAREVAMLRKALRCLLDCSDHQNPNVWDSAVAQAEALLTHNAKLSRSL